MLCASIGNGHQIFDIITKILESVSAVQMKTLLLFCQDYMGLSMFGIVL
jgi:hypothetical protein